MSMSRVSVVLLLLLFPVSGAASAQQAAQQAQQQCGDAMPSNVEPGLLAAESVALLRRSATFRAQCARIAADRRVHVRLAVVNTIDGGGRAQTLFRRYRGGAIYADVEVLFGENYRELLAHEFEHILEQIEDLNLRREAAEGRAWEVAAGTYETRRAYRAGVQVLREAEMADAAAPPLLTLRR